MTIRNDTPSISIWVGASVGAISFWVVAGGCAAATVRGGLLESVGTSFRGVEVVSLMGGVKEEEVGNSKRPERDCNGHISTRIVGEMATLSGFCYMQPYKFTLNFQLTLL